MEQNNCEHNFKIFKAASGDKPALTECSKCGVYVSLSDSLMIENIKYLKGSQKWLSIISLAISLLALAASVVLLPYQMKDYADKQNEGAFILMSQLEEKLSSKINSGIENSIYDNRPILLPAGRYKNADLESFLNVYEDLGAYFGKQLIPSTLICDSFGDRFMTVMGYKEIVDYIAQARKVDPTYYDKITVLENELVKNKCFVNNIE